MIENENSGETAQEISDNSQACCPSSSAGGECCASVPTESGKKWKALIFVVIILAAGAVTAHSLSKKPNSVSDQTFTAGKFDNSSFQCKPLDSLDALDEAAGEAQAVFVLLAAEDQEKTEAVVREVEAAAKTIQTNGTTAISAFTLKKGTPNYEQLAKQYSPPCVLAMVKGCGMNAVSGEITEAKLIEAFVVASRPASGCGPAGCCP